MLYILTKNCTVIIKGLVGHVEVMTLPPSLLPVLRGSLGPRPPPPADLRFPGPRDAYGPPMDLPPHSGPVGDSYPLQNSAGAQGGPGPGLQVKQEPPQDSRPAAVQP